MDYRTPFLKQLMRVLCCLVVFLAAPALRAQASDDVPIVNNTDCDLWVATIWYENGPCSFGSGSGSSTFDCVQIGANTTTYVPPPSPSYKLLAGIDFLCGEGCSGACYCMWKCDNPTAKVKIDCCKDDKGNSAEATGDQNGFTIEFP